MSFTFEHRTPTDSWAARWDPRWKLAAIAIAVFSASLLTSLAMLALAFGGAFLFVVLGKVPIPWLMARLGMVMLGLVPFLLVLPFTIDRGGLSWDCLGIVVGLDGVWVALAVTLRTLAIVTLVLGLLGTTTFHRLVLAAHCLRVPSLLIQITLLSYRYLFVLAEEFDRLRVALRVRGFRNRTNRHSFRTIGQATGTLLVRGSERAERVSQAMRCRGADGSFRNATDFQTRFTDPLAFLVFIGCSLGLLLGETTG